jgi:ABC-type branched-subunit amino acid transport system ATPase component/ABC-type branched-subunit amino acid transport system permease subunit
VAYIVATLIPLSAIAVILASSLNVMVGYGRMYSLAQAALYGAGAYTAALVALHFTRDAVVVGLCAMAVGGLAGLLLAIVGSRVKLEYFVIASLGVQMVFDGVVSNVGFTGGDGGLSGIPAVNVFGIAILTPATNAVATGLLAVGVVAGLAVFRRSAWGRQLAAVGEEELGAASVGKRIITARVTAAVVAGIFAGLAGALYANYAAFVNPSSFTNTESVTLLAMVIIGGAGTVLGPILGAVLLTIAPALLNFVSLGPATAGLWEEMGFGLIIVVVIRFRPDGMAGLFYDGVALARRRWSSQPPITDREPLAAVAKVSAGVGPKRQTRVGGWSAGAERDNDGTGLVISGLTKSFRGVRAVNDLNVTISPNRITGLIGPNGAGKSTVFKLVGGVLRPDRGMVSWQGRLVSGRPASYVARLGIGLSFQELRLFEDMSTAENLRTAAEVGFLDSVGARRRRVDEQVAEVASLCHLEGVLGERAGSLSYAEQKFLSLGRVLITGASLLLLDEPASGLDNTSLESFQSILRSVVASGRTTVCLIEHNFGLVSAVADHVLFLEAGRLRAQGSPFDIASDRDLTAVYLGKAALPEEAQ